MNDQKYILQLCQDILGQNVVINHHEKTIIAHILQQQKIEHLTADEADALMNVVMYYEDITDFGLGDELIDYINNIAMNES